MVATLSTKVQLWFPKARGPAFVPHCNRHTLGPALSRNPCYSLLLLQERNDEDDQESGEASKAITFLLKYRSRTACPISELAVGLHCSEGTAMLSLHAAAEGVARAEVAQLHAVVGYVSALKNAGAVIPLMYVHHQCYDETPLRIRLAFSHAQQATPQLGKIYAVQTQWSMLLQTCPEHPAASAMTKFLLLRGRCGAALRGCDSTKAIGVAALLRTCPEPPQQVDELFQVKLRAIETDGHPSNNRAEQLRSAVRPGWKYSHFMCAAHKCHSSVAKVWSQMGETISGITRTTLLLQSSQDLSRLLEVMKAQVERRCVIIQASDTSALSDEAQAFRKSVLEQLVPGERLPRKRSICLFFATVWNGDWRSAEWTHVCRGCCDSRATTVARMQEALSHLVHTLRPTKLNKTNWLDWAWPLPFIALGHVHQMLQTCFDIAFAAEPQDHDQSEKGLRVYMPPC